MRFSAIFKTIQFTGIFWNQRFLPYGSGWLGYGYSLGGGQALQKTTFRYGDGVFINGLIHRGVQKRELTEELGFFLLEYTTPFLSIAEPWTWGILHKIKARAYAGLRLRAGLPAHGQRTRSNHKTARRQKDRAAQFLHSEFGYLTGGYVASRGGQFVKKKPAPRAKGGAKGPKGKKRPAVRTIKKSNVWR